MLLTQAQAAAYLGTTPKSLSVMRSQGKIDIPFVKWGNRIRYEQKDLDAWIESNKTGRTDD